MRNGVIRTNWRGGTRLVVRDRIRARAFSLVEILVVIAIIGILLAIVFRGGSALLGNSKARSTEGLMRKINVALDEYRREVDQSQIPKYINTFNGYPPDDLRVFNTRGAISEVGGCEMRLRNSGFFLDSDGNQLAADDLIDERDGQGRLIASSADDLIHGDIRCMILAMRMHSPKARAVLDTIKGEFWSSNTESNKIVYDPDDGSAVIPLDYLVDAWGNPLEYYSTRRCDRDAVLTPREDASSFFVRENNDAALLVSYGPNGTDQFASDMMGSGGEGDTTIVADWYVESNSGTGNGVINHVFNTDNVYSSEFFAERMRQSTP